MLKICMNVLLVLFVHFVWNCADGEVSDGRIVGGRLAKEGEFPFQVSVRRSYNDAHFCGGSIISLKHVLTAAHCMYYVWGGLLPPIVISVLAGQLSLNITQEGVFRNASRVTIHPNFDKELMANDVAIIELAEDFPSEDKLISPIVLNNNKSVDDDLPCIVSGWGVQEYNEDKLSNSLLATEVEIINFASCSEKYLNINVTLQQGMLCATNKERKTDACQGDSGGPLICKGALMGIISTGSGCADSNFPGIYTDVKSYFSWIEDVVNPNVDEGRNDESSFDFTGDLTTISFDITEENFTEQIDDMINIRLNNTSNGCNHNMSLYFYGALIMLLNKL